MNETSIYSFYSEAVDIKNNFSKKQSQKVINLHYKIIGVFLPFGLQLTEMISSIFDLSFVK